MSEDISNALVDQKDTIWKVTNSAEDGDSLQAAVDLFRFAKPLWYACQYGYKVLETEDRIRERAHELLMSEQLYLNELRKNDKTRGSTLTSIAKLQDIMETV